MHGEITLLTLFLLGFFGGTHCIGMCGGLSSAFALQLPPNVGRIRLIILLNFGRIVSYVGAGAAIGAVSQAGMLLDDTRRVQTLLMLLANGLLLLTGLYLAGVSQLAARLEGIGKPVWRRLNPVLNRLLPVRSAAGCVAVGLLWGWLPCGLVYNAALYALGSGSAGTGAAYLLAFGLGTLPNLLAAGVFAAQLRGVLQRSGVRLAAGLTVAAWAAWQLANMIFHL
ncbi:sulfite exporter TauE/SafE family protein [Conchiformibius kuhniae]|uniref:Sulfite exporter TauE/SafE family protein n=1 Tax=Conchiformibius kuhniae TaxID=211502 RepID=A0A8T9MWE8_9NEIS|nr:sulfite exporter TauE/SafE family protein [Conchiformibius kuhniae]UOP05474.1 sulfite exporter TauE/SafE family protein [Conchiformibius kuhniae]